MLADGLLGFSSPEQDPSTLPETLPPLRRELQLHSSYPEADGSPAWVIIDPLINGFHRIGWTEYQVLKLWAKLSPDQLLQRLAQNTTVTMATEELEAIYQFLVQHQLVELSKEQRSKRLDKWLQSEQRYVTKLLHHYLFFRLPLVKPTSGLRYLATWFQWCHLGLGLTLVVGAALIGFLLTLLNWDLFFATLTSTFTPLGIVGYLVALSITKALHEMGHALVATRYGLRVSHMGVIFILGWPLLYTDTNEAWKLRSRRQRLTIDSAGILTELFIAGCATIAWHLTDHPDAKQVFFYLATTSWVLTLLLNISPFMRFDGYFILSDWLRYPNLHERSFTTAKVFLRRTLLGWNEDYAEPATTTARVNLVLFAFSIWLYRVIVFTGIAIAVYTFFFKVLGILLFAVEMYWFVLKPIIKELTVWQQGWQERTNSLRKLLLFSLLVGLTSLLFIPLPVSTSLYGYIQPQNGVALFAPSAGRLTLVGSEQQYYQQGDVLFQFEQPELAAYEAMANARMQSLASQLKGLGGVMDGEQQRKTLEQLTELVRVEKAANQEKQAKLIIRAPFSGQLVDVPKDYHTGSWVNTEQPLGYLLDPTRWQAVLYVQESQLRRLQSGSSVTLYPSLPESQPLTGTVTAIDPAPIKRLPYPMLSTRFGGELSVMEQEDGLTPRDRLFRVLVTLSTEQVLSFGTTHGQIALQPISVFADVIKPATLKLIQQLNF